jgi:MFS family permease
MSRNVVIMGVISFLNDMSSEMIYPIVPIFLTTVLGAPATIVGVIEGIADATANFATAGVGYYSDKIKKKKVFVSAGYTLSGLSKIVLAIANGWGWVLLSRFSHRLGRGFRATSRDALLVASLNKKDRSKGFALHRTMDNAGAIVGPIVGLLVLAWLNNDYRNMFLLATIPSFIAVALMVFVKEVPFDPRRDKDMRFEWSRSNRSFRTFLLVSFVFAVGNFSTAFLILKAQEMGLPTMTTIILYVLLAGCASVLAVPAGFLADKFGEKKLIFFAYALFAYIFLLFGLVDSSEWLWGLFPLFGVALAMTEATTRSYVSRLVPHEVSATAFGIHQMVTGIGTLIASSMAGLIWHLNGSSDAFLFASFCSIMAATLLLLFSSRMRRHPESVAIVKLPVES